MMRQQQLEAVKQKLLQRKDELEISMQRISKDTTFNEQVADPADQASASTMEDINISLQNTEHDEYMRIMKALEMIKAGTYGICADCHQPISEKRLQLYPNATRCLVCQEAAEERR